MSNIREKLTILRMTYGNLRKINRYLYLTDLPDTNIQKLINISTGEVVEERYVEVSYAPNGTRYCSANIDKLDCGLLFTLPIFEFGFNKFRIYNDRGKKIYELEIKSNMHVEYDTYETITNTILIRLGYASTFNESTILVYDKDKRKIEDVYDNIYSGGIHDSGGFPGKRLYLHIRDKANNLKFKTFDLKGK